MKSAILSASLFALSATAKRFGGNNTAAGAAPPAPAMPSPSRLSDPMMLRIADAADEPSTACTSRCATRAPPWRCSAWARGSARRPSTSTIWTGRAATRRRRRPVTNAVVGTLLWNMPVQTNNDSTAAREEEAPPTRPFRPCPAPWTSATNPGSNVAVPLFMPAQSSNTAVGFDENGKMFTWVAVNESAFTPDRKPELAPAGHQLYHWQLCYNYFAGYYYRVLSWATGGEPINPTCIAVNVTKMDTTR